MPLLTESEAKEKWCPQARVLSIGVCCNRSPGGEGDRNSYCLASGCMSWRWGERVPFMDHGRVYAEIKEDPEYLNAKLKELPEGEFDDQIEAIQKKYTENPLTRPEEVPESWEYHVDFCEWYEEGCVQWIESDETAKPRAEAKRRGYCGLAGKPEEADNV